MIFIKVDDNKRICDIALSGALIDQAAELCLGIQKYYEAIVCNMPDIPVEKIKELITTSLELVSNVINNESEV